MSTEIKNAVIRPKRMVVEFLEWECPVCRINNETLIDFQSSNYVYCIGCKTDFGKPKDTPLAEDLPETIKQHYQIR